MFPERYNYCGQAKIEKVDITQIPYKDNTFDLIMCNHVLEHIPNDIAAIEELFRVMKPNGFGIFQVPINTKLKTTFEDFSIQSPEERTKAFGQHDHVRVYGLDYKNRLNSAGFKVVLDDYVKTFSKKIIFKLGFSPTEILYKCIKQV
nr:class I SAM-dependent methyltransferase [Aestuariivivens marinum]